MQIPSAFTSGLQGFQRASDNISVASNDIARQPVIQQEREAAIAQGEAPKQEPNVTDALVEQVENLNYAEANVKSIQAASDTIGTLLDIKV